MAKSTPLTPLAYIKEMNDQLRRHSGYKQGMEVQVVPAGASDKSATGYHFAGRTDFSWQIVYVEVAHAVSKQYFPDVSG